jgi:hypothetical protein
MREPRPAVSSAAAAAPRLRRTDRERSRNRARPRNFGTARGRPQLLIVAIQHPTVISAAADFRKIIPHNGGRLCPIGCTTHVDRCSRRAARSADDTRSRAAGNFRTIGLSHAARTGCSMSRTTGFPNQQDCRQLLRRPIGLRHHSATASASGRRHSMGTARRIRLNAFRSLRRMERRRRASTCPTSLSRFHPDPAGLRAEDRGALSPALPLVGRVLLITGGGCGIRTHDDCHQP